MPHIVQVSFSEISRIGKSIETKWLPRALGREKWKVTTNRYDFFVVKVRKGFPGGLDGKESPCYAGDPSSIPRMGRSPGEEYSL